ncbi:Papain-like cysteine peptidase [Gracilaria domingensis]|nr:Papain-like cysteine peptidase [Gracilaria domingensis]
MHYWNWCEEQKHVADGKRPKRMPAMTQMKLMALYDSLKEESAENSKYAIEFMYPPKQSTCQGYISGARRLLQTRVVDYLCQLECAGIATFPRRMLNGVKTWKVEKICDRVDLWINRRKGGLHCDYKFTDTTGSEVDDRRRGRKRSRSISNSKKFKRPPLGWGQYLDWAQSGSPALLEELETKVEADVKEMESSRDPPDAEAFADLMLRQRIVAKVREEVYMTTEQGVSWHEFDLAQMVHDALARHRKDESKPISLMVRGGPHNQALILYDKDFQPILNFQNGTDTSIHFTSAYLKNWPSRSMEDFFVPESLIISPWFKATLTESKEPLISLRKDTKSRASKTYLLHHRCWQSKLTFLPIVGADHWSLAVLVNFLNLLDSLENNSNGLRLEDTACVFSLDSMQTGSPHNGFSINLLQYLQAAYPGDDAPSMDVLKSAIHFHPLKKNLQTGMECGFYASYYISLLSKDYSIFSTRDYQAIDHHMAVMRKKFTFQSYMSQFLRRLRTIRKKYKRNPNVYVQSPPFLCDGDETNEEPIDPESGQKSVAAADLPKLPIQFPSTTKSLKTTSPNNFMESAPTRQPPSTFGATN